MTAFIELHDIKTGKPFWLNASTIRWIDPLDEPRGTSVVTSARPEDVRHDVSELVEEIFDMLERANEDGY